MSGNLLQVVVFHLESKALALDILKVEEVLRMVEITPMPNMPRFALGVINLRGKIVPIINIREKLNLLERTPTVKTCIVLVRSCSQLLGFLVDDLSEVLSLPLDSIEKSDSGPEWFKSHLFLGVGKLPGGLLVIIDSEKLLSPDEEMELKQVSKTAPPFQD